MPNFPQKKEKMRDSKVKILQREYVDDKKGEKARRSRVLVAKSPETDAGDSERRRRKLTGDGQGANVRLARQISKKILHGHSKRNAFIRLTKRSNSPIVQE